METSNVILNDQIQPPQPILTPNGELANSQESSAAEASIQQPSSGTAQQEEFKPLTIEQQKHLLEILHNLREEHNSAVETIGSLKAIIGTVANRAGGTLILLNKQRADYFAKVEEVGFQPFFDISQKNRAGDLSIKLLWERVQAPSLTQSDFDPMDLAVGARSVGINVTDEVFRSVSKEERVAAAAWINALVAKSQGIEVIMPTKPHFLPDPVTVVATGTVDDAPTGANRSGDKFPERDKPEAEVAS